MGINAQHAKTQNFYFQSIYRFIYLLQLQVFIKSGLCSYHQISPCLVIVSEKDPHFVTNILQLAGVDEYLSRVMSELVPWAIHRFGLPSEASERYFGGSSFGGICALYMAMSFPADWAGVLVESPSFWAGNGRYMQDVAQQKEWQPASNQKMEPCDGLWMWVNVLQYHLIKRCTNIFLEISSILEHNPRPKRMYLAMGELEYTGFRGTERQGDKLPKGRCVHRFGRPGSLQCDAFLRDACSECAGASTFFSKIHQDYCSMAVRKAATFFFFRTSDYRTALVRGTGWQAQRT